LGGSQNLPGRPDKGCAILHRRPPAEGLFVWFRTLPSSADALRHGADMALPQTIVYVLESKADPARYYTGLTSNLAQRLDAHNAGRVPHTARAKPWTIDVVEEFSDPRRAIAFEKYLKSGSGCAFAQRHLR
jgi:putative endonuclease